jgi:type IV pilus biogenesis protein CpaD/CtpE
MSRVRAALAALALAAAAGCKGNEGPVAGELSVRIVMPRTTDRAILFTVVGAQHGVKAPSGLPYTVFADTSAVGDTTHVVVVAAQGNGLVPGEIARIVVADTRQAGRYTTRIIDVTSATLSVGDTAGVSLTVVKP